MAGSAPDGTSPTLLATNPPDSGESASPRPEPLPERLKLAAADYAGRLRSGGETAGTALVHALFRTESRGALDCGGTWVEVPPLLLVAAPPGLTSPTDMPLLVGAPSRQAAPWSPPGAGAAAPSASPLTTIGESFRSVSVAPQQIAAGLILVALAIVAGIAFGSGFVMLMSWLAGHS